MSLLVKNTPDEEPGSRRWEQFYKRLQKEIPEQFFDVFFQGLKPVQWSEGKLILESCDEKVISHLKNRYMRLMTSFAREISGNGIEVQIQLGKHNAINTIQNQEQVKPSRRKTDRVDPSQLPIFNNSSQNFSYSNAIEEGQDQDSNKDKIYVNPTYTFERFIKGPSNEHALAAAMGAVKNPLKYHNPLYFFGNVGLGKTHLLMAIANYFKEHNPWLKVEYIPSEIFQSDLIDAFSKKTISEFKAKYRSVDVLLIDDIQFISHRAEFTQETMFHTFNYLYQNKKQIVISGDRPPQQLSKLTDRLVSRFQSGLIVDIKPPGLETREAILKTRAREMNIQLSDDVAHYVASTLKSHVRVLESALIKLKFTSEYEKKGVDLNLVRKILLDLPGESGEASEITPDDIVEAVSKHFQVSREDLLGKSRMENIVLGRHIAMYLVRKLVPSYSLMAIAEYFGRKDHTTVMNALNKVKRMIDFDAGLKNRIDDLEESFSNL
jgi:chromosomal replication initiator protein